MKLLASYHMSLTAESDIHYNKVMLYLDDPLNVFQSPITSHLIEIETSNL